MAAVWLVVVLLDLAFAYFVVYPMVNNPQSAAMGAIFATIALVGMLFALDRLKESV